VYIRSGWRCEATGMPLLFPPTLCLLERVVSCAGQRDAPAAFGYYDLRQAMWNAPLLAMTFPAVDHVVPFAGGGSTSPDNAQALSGPVNETKGTDTLAVIPPHNRQRRSEVEDALEQATQPVTALYWPPSTCFWEAPQNLTPIERGKSRGRNAWCNEWDGMLGVFLALYRPDLPEIQVTWNHREHRGDPGFLATWYRTTWRVLHRQLEQLRRYEHLAAAPGLWPAPPP
jgi:hypothetical protein